jgi:hypothetical protein
LKKDSRGRKREVNGGQEGILEESTTPKAQLEMAHE